MKKIKYIDKKKMKLVERNKKKHHTQNKASEPQRKFSKKKRI